VGDQSSGKSSLLENLTGIPFPRNLELCTRYATQITSRRDRDAKVDVSIISGPNASDQHKGQLRKYHPPGMSPDEFRAKFPYILEEVCSQMAATLVGHFH
jgi:GTPase SAR1 family protein